MTRIIKKNNELDNYGTLTTPWKYNGVKYDVRKMALYADKKNVTITDLTEKEKEQFIIN